ncbi:MAG: DUF6249 domain-containing protein [Firmicutes bacterium]|nr:DUF6249 domain-containing protein [Bacillota bacterium]
MSITGVPFSFPGLGLIPIVAILFPVFLLAVILGFILLMRYLRYKESVNMIHRPVPPTPDSMQQMSPLQARTMNPYARLRSGIITSMVGIALIIGLLTIGVGPWLLGGLIPLAVGLGEILTFIIMMPTRDR